MSLHSKTKFIATDKLFGYLAGTIIIRGHIFDMLPS
jgi:hypothetical protein